MAEHEGPAPHRRREHRNSVEAPACVSRHEFCAYASHVVKGESTSDALREVCHLHSAIIGSAPADSLPGPARREAVEDFAHSLDAPGQVRRFVRRTLEEWGRPDLVADAMTVVSELATNAVIHARSDFTVVVASPGGRVRISVRDASPVPPVLLDPAATSATGRGIMLVAAIASSWGAQMSAQGKTVWAELRP